MTAPHLTPEQLAERWQRRVEWIRAQANAGTIPGVKVVGLWRFPIADVEAFESRHSNATADPLSMTQRSAQRQARAS